jgi:hypothetical protein
MVNQWEQADGAFIDGEIPVLDSRAESKRAGARHRGHVRASADQLRTWALAFKTQSRAELHRCPSCATKAIRVCDS